ncbi:MAG: hypothetical protein ABJB76_01305 [Candidatus Nitrosocosmicus sp.]
MSKSNNIVNNDNEINWTEALKKEARGIDEADFGEVQEITLHYILTERGIINKDKFYLPRDLVDRFDGDKLIFNISEGDAQEKFKRDTPPSTEEYAKYKKKKNATDDEDVNKKQINKKNASSPKSNISRTNETEESDDVKIEQQKQTESLSQQKKKSKPKDDVKQTDEIVDKEVEDRARQEAESKAQSIAQQIQDKAKMEAERKSHSIIQQAEDKARQEAEKRSKEIREEIDQKFNKEAEEKSHSIIQEAEDKARQEAEKKRMSELEITKVIDHPPQEESRKWEMNNYNEFFNPFTTSINLWQNYSTIWMNISKEIFNTAARATKDLENTMEKSWTNNTWYKGYKSKIV